MAWVTKLFAQELYESTFFSKKLMGRLSKDAVFQTSGCQCEIKTGGFEITTLLDTEVGPKPKNVHCIEDIHYPV